MNSEIAKNKCVKNKKFQSFLYSKKWGNIGGESSLTQYGVTG